MKKVKLFVKPLRWLVAALFTVLSVACTSATDDTSTPERPPLTAGIPVAGEDLVNTQWRLVSFGEQGAETPVLEATVITLEFHANGQAGGSAGCNPYGAQYSVQDGMLMFQQFVVTDTVCVVEDAREQESRYLQALEETDSLELSDDRLILHYGDGTGALNFVRFEDEIVPTPVSLHPGMKHTQ